jgi:CRP-like cAMP-binding protein
MNAYESNYFLVVANILLLVSYSVREVLWLRLLAAASSLIAIPYYALQPTPLWAPIIWDILFATINLAQSWRLYLERRPIQLTADEEDARRLAFPDLPPRKVLQILNIGSWTTGETGEQLIERGKHSDTVSLIIHGRVRVSRDELVIVELVAGDIVGSALLMTGAPADVDAVVAEPIRAISWKIGSLERYFAANPETQITMLNHLSRDFAGKIGLLPKTGLN